MKYLDEDITFSYTAPTTGYYEYRILVDSQVVYNGNMYCVANNKPTTVDITDILANYRFINKLQTSNVENTKYDNLVKTVIVERKTDNYKYLIQDVCMVYRYPNKRYEKYLDDAVNNVGAFADIAPCLQTTRFYKEYSDENLYRIKMLPHIPYIKTDKLSFVNTLFIDEHERKQDSGYIDFHYIMDDKIINSFTGSIGHSYDTLTRTTPLNTLLANTTKGGVLSICHGDIDNIKSKYDINIVDFSWTKGINAITTQQKNDFINECTKEFGSQPNEISNLMFNTSSVTLPTPVNATFNSQQEAINAYTRVNTKIPTVGGYTMSIRPIWLNNITEQNKEQTTDEMIVSLQSYFKNTLGVELPEADWIMAKELWFVDNDYWEPSYKFVNVLACSRLENYLNEQLQQRWYNCIDLIQYSHTGENQEPAFVFSFNPYIKSTEIHHNTGIDYFNEAELNCAKIWEGEGYVNKPSEIMGNKTMTINYHTDLLQAGFQYKDYSYSDIEKFECNDDTHIMKFVYDKVKHCRFEFSFIDNGQSGAKNNKVAFVQWNLENAGLVEGNEYTVKFSHSKTDVNTTVYSFTMTENVDMPVAIVDECPSRYYLMWQDRLGGIQSQRFNLKDTFKEDFHYQSIEDYQGHKRNINVQVQPKWELNTGVLTEDEYPIYESIFVSPDVILYDTELDKSYKVIPTGKSYTEKTWKNQRKMYNLTLEVELDKKQNIFA